MPKPQIDWGLVRGMAVSGIPLREIARQLGIPAGTVLWHSKNEGWGIAQKFGHDPHPSRVSCSRKAQLKLAADQTAQAANGASLYTKNIRVRHAISSALQKVAQHLESLPTDELFARCKELEAITRSADKLFGWSNHFPAPDDAAVKPELFNLSPDQLAKLALSQQHELRLHHAKSAHAHLVDPSSNQSQSPKSPPNQ
jgi:hypothetical protein